MCSGPQSRQMGMPILRALSVGGVLDAGDREDDAPDRRGRKNLVVALARRRLGMPRPVRLEGHLWHLARVGPAGGDPFGALRAAPFMSVSMFLRKKIGLTRSRRRVGQAKLAGYAIADLLSAHVEPRTKRGLQRSALHRAQHRRAAHIRQAFDPVATVGDIPAVMIPHRLRLDEQRLSYPLSRPATIQQQQSIHPTMHRTVQLPTHQRQEIRPIPSVQYQTCHPCSESYQPTSAQYPPYRKQRSRDLSYRRRSSRA